MQTRKTYSIRVQMPDGGQYNVYREASTARLARQKVEADADRTGQRIKILFVREFCGEPERMYGQQGRFVA